MPDTSCCPPARAVRLLTSARYADTRLTLERTPPAGDHETDVPPRRAGHERGELPGLRRILASDFADIKHHGTTMG